MALIKLNVGPTAPFTITNVLTEIPDVHVDATFMRAVPSFLLQLSLTHTVADSSLRFDILFNGAQLGTCTIPLHTLEATVLFPLWIITGPPPDGPTRVTVRASDSQNTGRQIIANGLRLWVFQWPLWYNAPDAGYAL